jgi:PAS domain S-box-containing protein
LTHQTYTLLIVEDAQIDRELYRRCLLKDPNCDYDLLEAESVEAGLEFCRTQSIDAILLDFQLPDGDGLEFLTGLAAQCDGKLPPVVMLTGQGDEKIAVRAMKLGAQDYLCKRDLTPELLQLSIRNAISNDRFRQQLAQGEDRFRASIDNMLDCVGIYTSIRTSSGQISDFRIDYLNPAAFANSRLTTADIGKRLCEEFTSLRETGLFDEYCQVVETGVPLFKEDLVYTDKFGGELLTRVYDIRFSKLRDGFICAWRDITERKQVEIARIEAERDRDRFFNLSIDLLGVANLDGYFTRLNPAFERNLGFTNAQLMAQPFLDFVHPDDRAATVAAMQQLSAGEVLVSFENRYHCQDGSYRWLLWSAMPDLAQNLIYANGHDITERKQIELARLEAENERDRFFNLSIDLLAIGSFDGYFTRLNPAFEQILGFTRAELMAEPFINFVHPDDRAGTIAGAKSLAAGASPIDRDNRYRCKDGSYRWISWTAIPHAPSQVWYANGHDITDRKQTQAALEQRNRDLDSFVHIVSHDLKAPLRAVANLSTWIEEDLGAALTTANQEQMSLLRNRVDRMRSTIDGLIDYARVGGMSDRHEPVVVAQLLDEVIDSLAPPPTLPISSGMASIITIGSMDRCTSASSNYRIATNLRSPMMAQASHRSNTIACLRSSKP